MLSSIVALLLLTGAFVLTAETPTTTITSSETLVLAFIGFAWSWILAVIKRFAPGLKGFIAHAVMMLISLIIGGGVLYWEGQLNSWADIVKSGSIIAALAVFTYHAIVARTELDKPAGT
jgi:hypothetical protein